MKVLVIPSWFQRFDGDSAGSYFLEQAMALASLGHRIEVSFVDFYGWREIGRFLREPRAASPERWPLPVHSRRALAIFSRQPERMHERATRIGLEEFRHFRRDRWMPDVLLSHSIYFGGAIANAIREEYGIPYVLYEHSSKFQRGILGDVHRRIGRHVAAGAARRLAVSEDLIGRLKEFVGGDLAWELLPNSVDELFAKAALSSDEPGRFLFTYLGNLVPSKQVILLLEAFHMVSRDKPHIQLQIIGAGPEAEPLKRRCDELGLSGQVWFTGKLRRKDVLLALQRSSALVQPSRYETFGVAIVEALAMGLPVIAFRSGGPKEIVGNQDGILIQTQDAPSLAGAMQRLITERGKFDQQLIRDRCLARFGQAALARRMETVLRSAAGMPHGR